MKPIFILCILFLVAITSMAKTNDTIYVKPADLDLKALQTGHYSYILYNRQTKESPAFHVTLMNFNIESKPFRNKPAFVVTQEWDRDTIINAVNSVFSATDFSNIVHSNYWKSIGYAINFDFEAKTVDFVIKDPKVTIPDSIKTACINDFNQSFQKYNLNWHADLIIYQLLPYKDKRTFAINFYDPGFGKAEDVMYTVTGSEILTDHYGKKIDCWVLSHDDAGNPGTYERFWIAKATKEVLKEEDFFGKRGYRYKIKIGISGDL